MKLIISREVRIKRILIGILIALVIPVLVMIFETAYIFDSYKFALNSEKAYESGNNNGITRELYLISNHMDRIKAEEIGATWFAALRKGDQNKLLKPLISQTNPSGEIEKLSPHMNKPWSVRFPANQRDSSSGTYSSDYNMSAQTTDSNGTVSVIVLSIKSLKSYEDAQITWNLETNVNIQNN